MDNPVSVTHSGIIFSILEPTQDMIQLEDVAYSLSNLNRFTGHSDPPYSVAEHCIHCSYVSEDPSVQRACLLHDLGEFVLADVSSPVKSLFPRYKEVEEKILCVAFEKYGLRDIAPWDGLIDNADKGMTLVEVKELMPRSKAFDYVYETYPVLETPPSIQCWSAKYAEKMFLRRAKELSLED
jgi:hypothetical protein